MALIATIAISGDGVIACHRSLLLAATDFAQS
jgi:hypothetical protein